jgi:hypothetical protein
MKLPEDNPNDDRCHSVLIGLPLYILHDNNVRRDFFPGWLAFTNSLATTEGLDERTVFLLTSIQQVWGAAVLNLLGAQEAVTYLKKITTSLVLT